MIWRALAFAAPIACIVVGASAGLLPFVGGAPSGTPPPAPAFAGDCTTDVICADHAQGQTALQWTDLLDGNSRTDYTKRYRAYWSLSPLNSGNCTAGTLFAKYIPPNSGQLLGGNPDVGAGRLFTPANRQANTTADPGATQAANPMMKVPDGRTGLTKVPNYYEGVQVYTALGTRNAYYCVVSTDTSDASPTFLGAVGPIGESVAPQKPIQYVHRGPGTPGNITYSGGLPVGTAGLPIVMELAGSTGSPSAAQNNLLGDYYQWPGDTTEGWQDGNQKVFDIFKDASVVSARYPSLGASHGLVVGTRDTIWPSTYGGSSGATTAVAKLETYHFGIGITPLNGTANRIYTTTKNSYEKFLSWVCDPSFYGADCTRIHVTGESMGADGGAIITSHGTLIKYASTWMSHPQFRLDFWRPSSWVGETWGGTLGAGCLSSLWPFSATLGCAEASVSYTLGSNSSTALFSDGTTVLGYFNLSSVWTANPGEDMPFFGGMNTKNDTGLQTGPASWAQIVNGLLALKTAHRGYAFAFYMGEHTTTAKAMGAINCDWDLSLSAPIAGICYNKSSFGTNIPYAAFDSSSLDDDIGTGNTDSSGLQDGAYIGCINCGFTWDFTTGTYHDQPTSLHFAVGNGWMSRSATPIPQTTLTSALNDTCSTTTPEPNFVTINDATWNGHAAGQLSNYFVIGTGATREAIFGSVSGTTVTITARCWLDTLHHAHAIGEQIIWFPQEPLGPNIGAQTAMTANVTPRRLQNFIKAPGASVSCTVTPFGGAPSTISGTVVGSNGVFTLPTVPINVGGVTDILC